MHLTTDAERRGLKTGFRALVHGCGGLEAAAAATRVAKTVLALGYDHAAADRFPAVDVVADLERAAGEPILTQLLAAMQGYALARIEPVAGCELRAIANVGERSSEVFAAFGRAMADGAITAEERALIHQELLDLVAAATEAAAMLGKGMR